MLNSRCTSHDAEGGPLVLAAGPRRVCAARGGPGHRPGAAGRGDDLPLALPADLHPALRDLVLPRGEPATLRADVAGGRPGLCLAGGCPVQRGAVAAAGLAGKTGSELL